jgi:hypothetical protein
LDEVEVELEPEEDTMNSHGEWAEKEGFGRLEEALENCMWRNKAMKSEEVRKAESEALKNSNAQKEEVVVQTEPKTKKKGPAQEGGIFALMGQALNNGSTTKKNIPAPAPVKCDPVKEQV